VWIFADRRVAGKRENRDGLRSWSNSGIVVFVRALALLLTVPDYLFAAADERRKI